jgi:hypothetical protein
MSKCAAGNAIAPSGDLADGGGFGADPKLRQKCRGLVFWVLFSSSWAHLR